MNRIFRTLVACLLALALLGIASAVAEQTEFNIISAISALSGGYAELNKMTEMIKFASIIAAALPMLVIYPFVQKYFEQGFMAGAVKG